MMQEIQAKNDRTTVSIPQSDMDNLKDIATSFIPAISEKTSVDADLGAKRLELSEKKLSYDQSIFKYKFWLLSAGLLALLFNERGQTYATH